MILVDNILAYCRLESITIAEFERRCKLSNGMVGKWERGKNNSPSLPTLMKIEKATGYRYPRWLKKGGIPDKKAASQ